ncbi:hypothetical protein BGZ96_009229 [Linnemannia gamsii]|uniref:Uncharacterized protein n=1 Tax=Linnemannia gamsii TaxID=64522 RepID=A0ABQ7KF56_9FUNG|nr:hypothetical protein BGZ96_009229 [Linnemannia gamsii]
MIIMSLGGGSAYKENLTSVFANKLVFFGMNVASAAGNDGTEGVWMVSNTGLVLLQIHFYPGARPLTSPPRLPCPLFDNNSDVLQDECIFRNYDGRDIVGKIVLVLGDYSTGPLFQLESPWLRSGCEDYPSVHVPYMGLKGKVRDVPIMDFHDGNPNLVAHNEQGEISAVPHQYYFFSCKTAAPTSLIQFASRTPNFTFRVHQLTTKEFLDTRAWANRAQLCPLWVV